MSIRSKQPNPTELADNQAWVDQLLRSVSGLRVVIDGNQRVPEHIRKKALAHIRSAVDELKQWDGR